MDITNDDLKDERPRRGLFKDPAAVPVWAGITALDEATRYEVLDLFVGDVPVERLHQFVPTTVIWTWRSEPGRDVPVDVKR